MGDSKLEIAGGKVILTEKRLDDAWMDYLWRTDEEVAHLDAAFPMKTKFEEFLRFFKEQLRYPTPASGRFGINTQEGQYIGNCMYYDMDTLKKQTEIGIVIGDRNYWGCGYGYDALVTMIDYLFSTTSMERLYLHTLEWNVRAQRAFRKSGFSVVTPVRRNGMEFLLMEIRKGHWLDIREEKLADRDAAAQTTVLGQ